MRSGLTPKASFWRSRAARRGRPGSGRLGCAARHRLLPRAASQRGRFSPCCPPPLCSQLVHRGILGSRRDGKGLRALAAPRAHTTVGFLAPPHHFGGKAAGPSLIGSAGRRGGEGAGKEDACVCFQFQFLPPLSFFSPKFLVFLPFFPSAFSLRRLLSQDVRGCLETPQPTPTAESLLLKSGLASPP